MTPSMSLDCLRVPWPLHLSELGQTDFMNEKSPVSPKLAPPPLSSADRASPHGIPSRGDTVYHAWKQSRACGSFGDAILVPGAQRPLNRANLQLAFTILQASALDLSRLICTVHPWRTAAMMALNLVRGIFPAFKGYSQALILNEVGPRPRPVVRRTYVICSCKCYGPWSGLRQCA
jgi:hypothetical protein